MFSLALAMAAGAPAAALVAAIFGWRTTLLVLALLSMLALIGLLLRTRDAQEFANFSAAVCATAGRVSSALVLPKPSVDERSA